MSTIMTGNDFATACEAQAGSAYIWGGLGYTLTEGRITQLKGIYPKVFTDSYVAKCRANIGRKAFDCVGLVKHFLWGNSGDGVLRHYNAATDYDANTMLKKCTETGKMNKLPELPGLLLHRSGHVGVYLGGGRIVEARGIDYGVVITRVADRDFASWGKLPGIDYPAGRVVTLAELGSLLKAQGITQITI